MSALASIPLKPRANSWATLRSSGSRRTSPATSGGSDAASLRPAGGGTIRARNDSPPARSTGSPSVSSDSRAPSTAPVTADAKASAASRIRSSWLRRGGFAGTAGKLAAWLSLPRMAPAAANTVVMKFGGTSVADAERIQRAAKRIVTSAEEGNSVVAVLSARGKHTDELVSLAHEVSPRPHPREMDMLLSTGERVSCALAAMVINDLGHEAISLTGSQAGIVTDAGHTKARILEVKAHRIRAALDDGKIVLVAGFQGVSQESLDVTTLGRGGSDTTAVALAAALGADVCEIYTDVAGVFSADPRIVPEARKLPVLTFEEMLEMSASGAGVLQLRSVEYARNHAVTIHCRSSFDDGPGTVVQDEEQTMERPLVTAVTHSTAEARVTLTGLPDVPGIAGRVLTALAEANINVDMIIQNEPVSDGHGADMSFTVPRDDVEDARSSLEALKDELGFGAVATDEHMGKVSVVGAGMKSHPGVAAKTFTVLGEADVNIEMISTSPIKISCVVREEHVETAVKRLHTAFELGADAVLPEDVAGVHRPKVA
jgi:aspartate kinase